MIRTCTRTRDSSVACRGWRLVLVLSSALQMVPWSACLQWFVLVCKGFKSFEMARAKRRAPVSSSPLSRLAPVNS